MPLEKKPNAEPIRGYRLIEPLGTGGFGEVWKCEAPGGIFKAIKFVYGNLNGLSSISKRAEDELRAVQHIKSIRHPFLLSIDRVESIQGELVIVTELADQNLHQHWRQYRDLHQSGIPRQELLFYLRETAEVLDLLNLQSNLQHLDIKPRNLFLVSSHVKVADFGLVQSLSLTQGNSLQMGAITPLYAAPELFQGLLSRHCDQYSLAIVYQEMLTGTLPFDGKNTRQLLMQHTQNEPNLSPVPPGDRPILARALRKKPQERFATCMDFVRALLGEGTSTPLTQTRSDFAIYLSPVTNSTSETQSGTGQNTMGMGWRIPTAPSLPAGVLPDYSFLDSFANSSLLETWKVQRGDSRPNLVHFVYGSTLADKQKLEDLSVRFRSLQHPGLVGTDLVHGEPGRLIFFSPLIRENLQDQFQQCRARKLPGIQRSELVDYLRTAAEVLDYLQQQHAVQHLGLNPRNLVLDRGWLQITEFGLAQLVWLPSGQDITQRNARYAAPELFHNKLSRSCDQYSLALIYAEMLTGQHPFQGQNSRRRGQPCLDGLPTTDQKIIARALHPDPAQRWPSATDMVMALEGTHPDMDFGPIQQDDQFTALLKEPRRTRIRAKIPNISENLHQELADIIASLGGEAAQPTEQAPLLRTDALVLEHHFQVGIPLGTARQQLEPFQKELAARVLCQEELSCEFSLDLPRNVWQRWRGHEPALIIQVQLARVHALSATPINVCASIRPLNLIGPRAQAVLEQKGPAIIETLRKHLYVHAEKRTQDRLLWTQPVQVIPLYEGREQGEPLECRGKDISLTGMGLYLPHDLDTSEILVQLPNSIHPPSLTIPGTLVRARRSADGWYDVGVLFHLPAVRKSMRKTCAV